MDIDVLHEVSLAVAGEKSVQSVLNSITEGLVKDCRSVLARIWLIRPGDICETCQMRKECPSQEHCLHLVSSSGCPASDPERKWSRLDGKFCRFPMNVGRVGQIASSGQPALLLESVEGSQCFANPQWARENGVQSFAGHPLIFHGEVLGVLAVFAREPLKEEEFEWLGFFANQAAVAISNARAFEEIDSLRKKKELENLYLREEIQTMQAYGDIVGTSSGIRKVMEAK